MEHFYIITNRQKDKGLQVTKHIEEFLKKQHKTCTLQQAEHDDTAVYTDQEQIPENTDCIIVLGGDGTLLRAALDTKEREIPLFGVNLGTLGYLAEVETVNLDQALLRLIDGEYEVEPRMLLEGHIQRKQESGQEEYALNDVVVTRGGSMRIIRFHIYVNGQFLNTYDADGVIIATPTGSTGYNMSAGGPIVEPKAKLILVTPICPHTLNTRSIVLAPEDEIEIEISEGKDGKIQSVDANFDGSVKTVLHTGDRIMVKRSKKEIEIVKINSASFLETLHKKMNGA